MNVTELQQKSAGCGPWDSWSTIAIQVVISFGLVTVGHLKIITWDDISFSGGKLPCDLQVMWLLFNSLKSLVTANLEPDVLPQHNFVTFNTVLVVYTWANF